MLSKSALFSGLVCMRKLTVRTNWPTVAEKPERKALKGCVEILSSARRTRNSTLPQVQWPMDQRLLHVFSPRDGKHGYTHKVASNHAVGKLQHAHGDQEDEESIEQLHALRRLVDVLVPDADADLLQVLCAAHLAAGAGGGFVGGASWLAGGGGDDGCGFGCAGRGGGRGGSGGDLLGSHVFWFVSCLAVAVKRNGLESLVVASLVRRSSCQSFTCTATQAPAGFLPRCARVG